MTAIRQHTRQHTSLLCHNRNNNTKNEYNCHNYRWTIVIFSVIILMIVSVVLAIVFPYRGDNVVMMSSSPNSVGDIQIDALDDNNNIDSSGKKKEDGSKGVDNINDGGSSSVSLSGGVDNNNEGQPSNELLSPLDSSSTKVDNMNKQQHGGGGLFDYDATPYDPTNQQHQEKQQQAEETQLASSINTSSSSSSSLSSCQTNLQQADIDMNKIIDETEYISFLRHYIVNDNVVVEEVNDFEELPIEYQVNFNHLASSNGIPIATFEEIQKVCLYISNKGSSAIDEFDWGQISTLKQQQQNEGM